MVDIKTASIKGRGGAMKCKWKNNASNDQRLQKLTFRYPKILKINLNIIMLFRLISWQVYHKLKNQRPIHNGHQTKNQRPIHNGHQTKNRDSSKNSHLRLFTSR